MECDPSLLFRDCSCLALGMSSVQTHPFSRSEVWPMERQGKSRENPQVVQSE